MTKFPFIKQIHVNDCFTYQNLDIPQEGLSDFKHIIITGKNGSGKTTILNRIALQMHAFRNNRQKDEFVHNLKSMIANNQNHPNVKEWGMQLSSFLDVDLLFSDGSEEIAVGQEQPFVFSYYIAQRRVELKEVLTVTKESLLVEELKKELDIKAFTSQFKQYLVNKKVYEAFDLMNSKSEGLNQNRIFFESLVEILRQVFEDEELSLDFEQENFEFYIVLNDGRKLTFNQLSEGFAAFIGIFMDLLMRVDLIRKSMKDFSFEPTGIVLIDEPETHLHLAMQYQILPLLTTFFPNLQFIVATHSPAVISSIKNAVVYDLGSKREVSGLQAGSSYSELMLTHFGLENEFSPVADKILSEIEEAVQRNDAVRLKAILEENASYLTLSLRFAIENQIIIINSKSIKYD
jgi:predicted ATP-binding protein involved in virulence